MSHLSPPAPVPSSPTPGCFTLGALPQGNAGCQFRVWAPRAQLVEVQCGPDCPWLPLQPEPDGYHAAWIEGVPPNTDYRYRLDASHERPDPASRWQPLGVHGPSRILDPHFPWDDDAWTGLPLADYVLYELHVGTFTPTGTFEAVMEHLPQLRDLGITALELMPVAQFPGSRNWGYDGVFPFAAQHSYGGPLGLKRLVNAAHQHQLAVVLDVVYNHLGPEGNVLADCGPYFTDRYRIPWGQALNFDGPHSDPVRRFFLENALYWQTEFHCDALRLDAVHAIHDHSAFPFLEELALTCHRQAEALPRPFHLIAESDLNNPRHTLPRSLGGYGLDAQWSDDFHHTLHVLLTGERDGYYADYGDVAQLAKAWREGFAFTGEFSPHRRRRHGASPRLNPLRQFVVCAQNHDQIGNRKLGDRLAAQLPLESLKLAAGAVLLSPFVPLLFMGEEYGETAPFQFFVSHSDPHLIEAVRQGRRDEFAAFHWQGEIPDPLDPTTFQRCLLNRSLLTREPHRTLHAYHRELLALRRRSPALHRVEKDTLEILAADDQGVFAVRQWHPGDEVILAFNFAHQPRTLASPWPRGEWRLTLDSADLKWAGPGSHAAPLLPGPGGPGPTVAPTSLLVYHRLAPQ